MAAWMLADLEHVVEVIAPLEMEMQPFPNQPEQIYENLGNFKNCCCL